LPGSYAERVGIEPGDVLLQLGDVGLYDMVELWVLGRALDHGIELEAIWARGRERHQATATL
jgi:hypothetical protein